LKQRVEVGICGSSLFLAGIEASLKTRQGLRIRRVGECLTESELEIKMLSPNVVLFEMSDDAQPLIAVFFWEYPGIKWIGVESKNCSIIVFSTIGHSIISVEELVRMIDVCADRKDI